MLDSEVSWKVLLISISAGLRLLLWLGVPRNSVLHGADVSLHCAALHRSKCCYGRLSPVSEAVPVKEKTGGGEPPGRKALEAPHWRQFRRAGR